MTEHAIGPADPLIIFVNFPVNHLLEGTDRQKQQSKRSTRRQIYVSLQVICVGKVSKVSKLLSKIRAGKQRRFGNINLPTNILMKHQARFATVLWYYFYRHAQIHCSSP